MNFRNKSQWWFLSLFFIVWCHLAQAKTLEITLWHSLAGDLEKEVQRLADGFNRSQSDYRVQPIYKGGYQESLASFAAAFQAKQPPALVQVFEVGSSTVLYPKGIIKPVGELLREVGVALPESAFFPVVRAYYSQNEELMAMPFNISLPVLFYNVDALNQAGYTPASFPKTWDEMEILAKKLKQAGYTCTYTSAYPAWILIESFAALHGLSFETCTPGESGSQLTEECSVHPAMLRHLNRLKDWQAKHYFVYGGRDDDATVLFTSGRCPLFSQSSGAYRSLTTMVPFRVGMASLPLDVSISKHRYPNVVGGAALWVVAGHSKDTYRGIAEFFVYLSQADVQKRWHQNTGYLPLGLSGAYQIFTQKPIHPALVLAQEEFVKVSPNGTVPRNVQNQIRRINDEALEEIFAGMTTSQAAIGRAIRRSNQALRRFQKNIE